MKGEPGTGESRTMNCYRLELADTMTMDLLTTSESDELIRKVAKAMRLRKRPHVETVQTVRKISESGPQARRYGVLTLCSNGNGTHLISDVGATMLQQLTVREVWQSFYPFYERLVGLGGLGGEDRRNHGPPTSKWPCRSTDFFLRGEDSTAAQAARMAGQEASSRLPWQDWSANQTDYIRVWSRRKMPDVIVELLPSSDRVQEIQQMWHSLFPIVQRTLESGGFPIHAALIEKDARDFLMAGPGGTGKSSTCSRLPGPWRPLCDDQSLVIRNREGKYCVHALPTWSDYIWQRGEPTWAVEEAVPLSGILFLRQAEIDRLVGIGEGETALRINTSIEEVYEHLFSGLQGENLVASRRLSFERACEVARTVPGYVLETTLTGRCWEEMEKVMEGPPPLAT